LVLRHQTSELTNLNTQTHVLLASALFIPAAHTLLPCWSKHKYKIAALAVFLGSILPDASLFLMFAIAKSQGVSEQVIFSEWYYHPFWQNIGALTNSIPVYGVVALISYLLIGPSVNTSPAVTRFIGVCLVTGLAAVIHTLTDLPLHHDDGHPHFWPFSRWIFESPVSYWDPKHFGAQWSLIELVLAVLLIVFLWRRFKNRFSRVALVFTAISYAAMAAFWLNTF